MRRMLMTAAAAGLLCVATACHKESGTAPPRASGYVEATEVRVAAKVPGRIVKILCVEGQRVAAGDTLIVLSTTDTDLALQRVQAERSQADAQLQLLRAGSRPEDIDQATAQVAAAASDRQAADAELAAARADEARFEQLLRAKAGAQKPRDDAAARRELAEARLKATNDRLHAATAALDRLKAGARKEELDAARARVAAIDAQIASLNQDRSDATIVAPLGGIVSSRLAEPGELIVPRAPLLVLVDLDHAWASAYVEEPVVPGLKLDQVATVVTDAGDRLSGRITFISPRAEFTPRNVQTTAERAKLVYRVKVAVDNSRGVLKPGMPVEVDFSGGGGK